MVTGRIQVDGKELDVEMEGKTKADGKVGLEGSIQQGKEQVKNSVRAFDFFMDI